MGNPLRAIALTVDEPSPGLFYWTLLESGSGRRTFDQHVAAADDAYDPFEKAARAGLLRWLRLAGDDVRHGPRQPRVHQPLVPQPGPWTRSTQTATSDQA